MRAIDYFDRGHDIDPDHACLIDAASGETLSFAQVSRLTRQIAVALYAGGFRNQEPIALYGPNSAAMMVALLAIWRANGQWVPVNTRNAIDANAAYLDYVGADRHQLGLLRPGGGRQRKDRQEEVKFSHKFS